MKNNGLYLNGNNIRALFSAGGSQFWDGDDAQFFHDEGISFIATIFTQGLWLGAE